MICYYLQALNPLCVVFIQDLCMPVFYDLCLVLQAQDVSFASTGCFGLMYWDSSLTVLVIKLLLTSALQADTSEPSHEVY